MSMSAHGMSRLYCVCRCSSGRCNARSPAIHIFAGEKVCIHATIPTHRAAAFASSASRWISSGVVSTGLNTTRTGTAAAPSKARAIVRECSATCSSVSGP